MPRTASVGRTRQTSPHGAGTAPSPVHPLGNALRGGRVLLGLALLVLGMLPVYRLLDHPGTGLAGTSTVQQLDIYFELMTTGLLLLLPLFIIGARFVPRGLEARIVACGEWLGRVDVVRYATALALLSAALGSVFVLRVLEGLPSNIDALAQLLHARYWAEGRLAGPVDDGGGFMAIQNALFTERGWVSQYPPGHVLVLAAFLRLGVPWLAGPVMMAVTVFFSALLAGRLLPDRPIVARTAPVLLAVSPFFIALGASYMNHVTTAAMITVGGYALVRAWQGRVAWALLAGAAFGLSLAARPLSTVAMAAALTLLVPFTAPSPRGWRFVRIGALVAVGAAPFVGLLLAYNAHFFGSPFRFGYEVALGPQMSLGLHRDPWGNLYGIREAIAYTSADLLALGVNLLETPLSAVLVAGLFLVLQPRLSAGERVLAGWALAPVAANLFYWHHGLYMGPRMLHEATSAWVLLVAVATVAIVTRVPQSLEPRGYNVRRGLVTTFAGAVVVALVMLGPQRLASYGDPWLASTRTPAAAAPAPAIVFVHGGWTGRVGLTLAAHGYRLDIVETLLRQNPTCSVHGLARAVVAADATAEAALIAQLDTVPRPDRLPAAVPISPGNDYRAAPGERLSADCEREIHSDRFGILDASLFLWRGALPGPHGDGVLYARDLGPERNARFIVQYPDRTPYVYAMPDPQAARPVLLPYEEGMTMLWGSAVTAASMPAGPSEADTRPAPALLRPLQR